MLSSNQFTIRDFITECELFPYSQEYFEMCKESYELDLAESYLESVSLNIDISQLYIYEAENILQQTGSFLKNIARKIRIMFKKFIMAASKLISKLKSSKSVPKSEFDSVWIDKRWNKTDIEEFFKENNVNIKAYALLEVDGIKPRLYFTDDIDDEYKNALINFMTLRYGDEVRIHTKSLVAIRAIGAVAAVGIASNIVSTTSIGRNLRNIKNDRKERKQDKKLIEINYSNNRRYAPDLSTTNSEPKSIFDGSPSAEPVIAPPLDVTLKRIKRMPEKISNRLEEFKKNRNEMSLLTLTTEKIDEMQKDIDDILAQLEKEAKDEAPKAYEQELQNAKDDLDKEKNKSVNTDAIDERIKKIKSLPPKEAIRFAGYSADINDEYADIFQMITGVGIKRFKSDPKVRALLCKKYFLPRSSSAESICKAAIIDDLDIYRRRLLKGSNMAPMFKNPDQIKLIIDYIQKHKKEFIKDYEAKIFSKKKSDNWKLHNLTSRSDELRKLRVELVDTQKTLAEVLANSAVLTQLVSGSRIPITQIR